LVSIGIIVSNWEGQDPIAPAVSVTLRSITDTKFEIQVKMEKSYGVYFIKNYEVVGDAINPEERTPENLEKRAYRMTNKLVETILVDPEFKNAFLRATATKARSQDH